MDSHCIIEEDVQDEVLITPIMPSHTLGMLPKEPPISLIKEIKTQISWKKHNRMKGLVFFLSPEDKNTAGCREGLFIYFYITPCKCVLTCIPWWNTTIQYSVMCALVCSVLYCVMCRVMQMVCCVHGECRGMWYVKVCGVLNAWPGRLKDKPLNGQLLTYCHFISYYFHLISIVLGMFSNKQDPR